MEKFERASKNDIDAILEVKTDAWLRKYAVTGMGRKFTITKNVSENIRDAQDI